MALAPLRPRWEQALGRVGAVERYSSALSEAPGGRAFAIHGRVAVRQDIDVAAVPDDLRPTNPAGATHEAPVEADLVTIGKFDVDREVRLRAFYSSLNRTVRFQAGGARNGVERSLLAYRHLVRYAPRLAPQVLDSGSVGAASYLVEQVACGRRPAGPQDLEAAIEDLTAQLAALHQGVGVEQRPLAEVLGAGFAARWSRVREAGLIDDGMDRVMHTLLDRQGTVPVSLGHGDLVGTNILLGPGGVTLIDWEYAGWMPVLFDVAKLHLHCPDRDHAAHLLAKGLGSSLRQGTGDYSIREQLALAHLRYLSWSAERRRRAAAANRLSQLQRVTSLRIRATRELLG